MKCNHCEKEFESEERLAIHLLIEHPEKARDEGVEVEVTVSEGFLHEREIEKGEQFGYER